MYISPYCRLVLVPPNFMKIGIRGQLTVVITCVKFLVDWFSGYGVLTPPKIAISHWLAASPLQECTHYRATLWYIHTYMHVCTLIVVQAGDDDDDAYSTLSWVTRRVSGLIPTSTVSRVHFWETLRTKSTWKSSGKTKLNVVLIHQCRLQQLINLCTVLADCICTL